MRGALGVVKLATQMLEETQGTNPSFARIQNACRRLSVHFEELRATMRALQAHPEPPARAAAATIVSELERHLVQQLQPDFPRRTLAWAGGPPPPVDLPLGHLQLILGGMVDGATKTTPGRQGVMASCESGNDGWSLLVRADNAQPPSGVARQLGTPVADWSLGEERDVPFRLVLAARLAAELGAELRLVFAESTYEARLVVRA
jgi:hypothetical protein